jgi:hypothetical protein
MVLLLALPYRKGRAKVDDVETKRVAVSIALPVSLFGETGSGSDYPIG